MEVILLQRVPKLGQMGETVKVKDGYARNFLLPSGKALRATKANKERFDPERVQLEAHNLEAQEGRGDGRRQARRASLSCSSARRARAASSTARSPPATSARPPPPAASRSAARRSSSTRRSRHSALHAVTVQLHPEVEVKVAVNVARSPDEAERQARGENVSSFRDEDEEETSYENPEDVEIPGVPGTGEQPDV